MKPSLTPKNGLSLVGVHLAASQSVLKDQLYRAVIGAFDLA